MTTENSFVEVRNQVDSHSGNMHGVLNLLILFFAEVKPDERPKSAELFGMFSFLNAEAQAIAEGLESCPSGVISAPAFDSAYSTRAITNALETCFRVNDLEIPFGDFTMDNLVTAIMSSLDRTVAAMNAIARHQNDVLPARALPPAASPAPAPAPARRRVKDLEAA